MRFTEDSPAATANGTTLLIRAGVVVGTFESIQDAFAQEIAGNIFFQDGDCLVGVPGVDGAIFYNAAASMSIDLVGDNKDVRLFLEPVSPVALTISGSLSMIIMPVPGNVDLTVRNLVTHSTGNGPFKFSDACVVKVIGTLSSQAPVSANITLSYEPYTYRA